ncbi:ABC transporter permease [Anaerovorax odorimutans]|uniref:ABC transporter permease n=1 Tax=Anaerovorax odorimutans TaxID=109327 RepID=UPI00041DEC1C|nr:ABC transporter permease [Anaerovorax odorimutans]
MVSFLCAAVIAGMPLLFATLGELITEKAGNLNLGVEGMMLMGASCGFIAGYITGNPIAAILAAIIAGGIGAAIYAFLTITLMSNQVVTGLALTIFGTGFASFVGKDYVGKVLPDTIKTFFMKVEIPGLSDIPVIGPMFFKQDIFAYGGYVIIILISIYLYKTRKGLNLRAVGENAASADASGINVTLYKYVHILIGGALCGLGGAYMSLVTVPVWQEGVTGGRGWIAVALVIFASWNPVKAFAGSLLFGGLSILGIRLQSMGIHISQYLVDMLPYLATVVVLILSTYKSRKEDQPPKDLGNAYFREER